MSEARRAEEHQTQIDGRGQMLSLTGVTGGEDGMGGREPAKNTGIILYLIRQRGLPETQGGLGVTCSQAFFSKSAN